MSEQKAAKTLQDRQYEAEQRKESALSAAVAHVILDKHHDRAGYDQWYLPIVLGTLLGYLYTQSIFVVLIAFVLWYFFESIIWQTIGVLSSGVARNLRASESRSREAILDPFVFLLAVFAAWFVYSHSIVSLVLPPAPFNPLSTGTRLVKALVVVLVGCLAGFLHLYWPAMWLQLIAVWLVFAFDSSSPRAVEVALVATITIAYVFMWFVRPVARHFLYNALFAILYAALVVAIVDIVSIA